MIPLKINDKIGKLNCTFFLHIMRGPKPGFLQSNLPMPMQVITNEQVYDVMFINFSRSKLNEITSIETFASEGLTREAFIEEFLRNNPSYSEQTEVATYIFKKVNK